MRTQSRQVGSGRVTLQSFGVESDKGDFVGWDNGPDSLSFREQGTKEGLKPFNGY